MTTTELILKLLFVLYASGAMGFSMYSIKWIRDAEYSAYRRQVKHFTQDPEVRAATKKYMKVNIPLLIGIVLAVYLYNVLF